MAKYCTSAHVGKCRLYFDILYYDKKTPILEKENNILLPFYKSKTGKSSSFFRKED